MKILIVEDEEQLLIGLINVNFIVKTSIFLYN